MQVPELIADEGTWAVYSKKDGFFEFLKLGTYLTNSEYDVTMVRAFFVYN
jgi:hypothetical protein